MYRPRKPYSQYYGGTRHRNTRYGPNNPQKLRERIEGAKKLAEKVKEAQVERLKEELTYENGRYITNDYSLADRVVVETVDIPTEKEKEPYLEEVQLHFTYENSILGSPIYCRHSQWGRDNSHIVWTETDGENETIQTHMGPALEDLMLFYLRRGVSPELLEEAEWEIAGEREPNKRIFEMEMLLGRKSLVHYTGRD